LKYIATLRPGTWEHWREDWVLVQIDAHERLMLSTAVKMTPHVDWEQDLSLAPFFNPVLGRIRILDESGLTSMMVLHDYVLKRIAPPLEAYPPGMALHWGE
jgi:hypothetical protein